MKIPEAEVAELGGIEGSGYAFTRRTYKGDIIEGVFFGDNPEELEALIEKDQVRFDGVVYKKLRSGNLKKKMQSLLVDVKRLVSVAAGERVTFKVLAEAES